MIQRLKLLQMSTFSHSPTIQWLSSSGSDLSLSAPGPTPDQISAFPHPAPPRVCPSAPPPPRVTFPLTRSPRARPPIPRVHRSRSNLSPSLLNELEETDARDEETQVDRRRRGVIHPPCFSRLTIVGPFSFSRRITAAGPPSHRPSSRRPKGKQ
jgi:hypothetical protein